MLFYAFLMVNEKQMRIKEEMERSATLRTKASFGRKGANIIAERDLGDMQGGGISDCNLIQENQSEFA